jgi:hypothetical protein
MSYCETSSLPKFETWTLPASGLTLSSRGKLHAGTGGGLWGVSVPPSPTSACEMLKPKKFETYRRRWDAGMLERFEASNSQAVAARIRDPRRDARGRLGWDVPWPPRARPSLPLVFVSASPYLTEPASNPCTK